MIQYSVYAGIFLVGLVAGMLVRWLVFEAEVKDADYKLNELPVVKA